MSVMSFPEFSQVCHESEAAYISYLQLMFVAYDARACHVSENGDGGGWSPLRSLEFLRSGPGGTAASAVVLGLEESARVWRDSRKAVAGAVGTSGFGGDCGSGELGGISGYGGSDGCGYRHADGDGVELSRVATGVAECDVAVDGSGRVGDDVEGAMDVPGRSVGARRDGRGVEVDGGSCPTAFGVLVGPNGGLSYGRGPNYERNRARREKVRGAKSGKKRVTEKKTGLQMSLEAKWESENKLAKEKADRQLELLRSRDLESEKKMQRAQIMRTTEAAKVQTERAYASLKRTGNVPGFAETVVTDGSCPALSPNRSDGTCISPDSSVSQQEIRAMMKELEDYKLTLSRIERDNPALVAHHMEGHGVKTAFTLDSDGMCPVDEPGCMGIDGKYHLDSYERNPKFYKDRFRAEEATERYFNRE